MVQKIVLPYQLFMLMFLKDIRQEEFNFHQKITPFTMILRNGYQIAFMTNVRAAYKGFFRAAVIHKLKKE